jgi:hypothetical protein
LVYLLVLKLNLKYCTLQKQEEGDFGSHYAGRLLHVASRRFMTSPFQSISRCTAGLGPSGASVERPVSRDSLNYTLRCCVTPPVSVEKDGAININRLPSQQHKTNVPGSIPATSVFEVVEFVRPFSSRYSSPSAYVVPVLSVKHKATSSQSTDPLLTQPSSQSPSFHLQISPSERRKGGHKCMPFTNQLHFELSHESGATSRSSGETTNISFDGPSTKSLLGRMSIDDHNGSGFKRKSGDDHIGSGAVCLHTKTRARPWHQIAEPIPMKYFMNGVRVHGGDSPDTIASAAVETGALRPSLFSLRCHHDSLHKSLKSLLQTPDRVRMPEHTALDFIQGQVDVWFAACQGDTDLVAAYIDAGVIVDALDRRYGRTPLQYAAGNNNTAIMRLLLQAGADVHSAGSRDKHSNTPLHFAARYGKTEAARYLLDNKSDGMRLNANGFTPLDLAAENGHTETASLLKKYGAVLELSSTKIPLKHH